MESAHHFSSKPDCNVTADVPSLILRTTLSAILFVLDRCQIPRNCLKYDFWLFADGSRNFRKLLSVSWEVLVWHGYDCIHWVVKSSLYHDSISMVVSRFTSFTENFVICCNQVTKVCCSKYCFTSAFPARSPWNLGSLADLAIKVFREVSTNTVLPWFWYHFRRTFRIWVLSVQVQALLCPLDYLWNPLTTMEDVPTDRSHFSCHCSGIPAPVSW